MGVCSDPRGALSGPASHLILFQLALAWNLFFRMHSSTCSVSLNLTRLAKPVRLLFISSGGEFMLQIFLFFFFFFNNQAEKMKLASPPALDL